MVTFHEIRSLRKDAGFALIWVLFVVAIISALSLAFLHKVSIGTAATVTRGNAMQAHYLARAAANHALWRLLNEPGFPASESVYYMHDLGSGRYGYKVRQPTLTKFGTVATVGGAGTTVTKQSYVHNTLSPTTSSPPMAGRRIRYPSTGGSSAPPGLTLPTPWT